MTALLCKARVRVADGEALGAALLGRFIGFGMEHRSTSEGEIVAFPYGAGVIKAGREELLLTAKAADTASLAMVKEALAYQIRDLGSAGMSGFSWTGDGCGEGGCLAHFREMRVADVADVTPRLRRVTLEGDDIGRFAQGGLHLRLVIPPRGRLHPIWPRADAAGLPVWPRGKDRLWARSYTIRRIDPAVSRLDIEIVLHQGSAPGSDWALHVRAGDPVGILGPGGGTIGEADWYLLAGDETALPAIARILEELAPDKCGLAFIEVADVAERQALRHPPGFDVRWIFRDRRPAGTDNALVEAVEATIWPESEEVFAFAGCEFSAFTALRRHFRKDRGLKRAEHLAMAYWRRGRSEAE